MLLDRQHLLGQERLRPFLDQRAERAVALVAAGAAGDLCHLRDRQSAAAASVELVQPGEGDMRHVHVEAHADRVGRDEIIDLACLEHRHLRVAGARGERAHHHRRPAAQPAQHFRHRVNLLGGEGDDRGAARQAADLLRPRIAERREARPLDDLRAGDEMAQHRAQRIGAEDHRLLAPTRVEQPVGEDVAALRVRAELRLVQCDEGHVAEVFAGAPGLPAFAQRHALGGAQEPARVLRHDAFLAGDQRDALRPLHRHHPVIDLARQQPQREADHPAGMRRHPLDGEVGLAGIGGAEHRGDAGIVWNAHDRRYIGGGVR